MAVAALSPISLTPIFDNNGQLVPAARLYFYRPDTLDPITVYKDQELSVPHPQPVAAGGSGRVPPIYVGPDPQRLRIFDGANQLVEDVPWLPGATEPTSPGGGGADTAIETGDTIWRFSNGGVRAGWVRLNGGTIGSAASGASERANDDTHALFLWLWGQDIAGLLAITPGRGASAEADWLANKQLALPDTRNAFLGGTSTMGRPAVQRLLGAILDAGTLADPGARGGRPTHQITAQQMPVHTHAVTDPGHNHVLTDPKHLHPLTDPGHNHGVTDPTHAHGLYDPGHAHGVNDPGHNHPLHDPGHAHNYLTASPSSGAGGPYPGFVAGWGNRATDAAGTGMWMDGVGTGIWVSASGTGMGVYAAGTGISIQAKLTGITMGAVGTGITIGGTVTGISIQNAGGDAAMPIVPPFVLGTFYMKL